MGNWSYNPTYRSYFTPFITGRGPTLYRWCFFWSSGLVGGWTTHLKNMRKSKWVHLPQFSGWKFQKYLSCHHLVVDSYETTFVCLVLDQPLFGAPQPNLWTISHWASASSEWLVLTRFSSWTWTVKVPVVYRVSSKNMTQYSFKHTGYYTKHVMNTWYNGMCIYI